MASLGGEITQWTVAAHTQRLKELLADGPLDLSQVTRADSSAVALLIALRREAGAPLELHGVPSQLQNLIDFFGVNALLTG